MRLVVVCYARCVVAATWDRMAVYVVGGEEVMVLESQWMDFVDSRGLILIALALPALADQRGRVTQYNILMFDVQ